MKRQRKLVVVLLIIMYIGTAAELFSRTGNLRMVVVSWGFYSYFISRQAFSRQISICLALSYILLSLVLYCVAKGQFS